MLSYDRLKHSPRALRTFTGLDKDAFAKVLVPFAPAWNTPVAAHQSQEPVRKRRIGGGRKARRRSVEDKLLFILFYCNTYPLQEVIALVFARSPGRANEGIHTLSTVLTLALGDLMG